MPCMGDQLTLRIPRALARALTASARERGVPKSQVVREALHEYLGQGPGAADRAALLRRLESYRGVIPLDPEAIAADPLARQISEHNWRE
jgi:hypothetical protein